MPEQRVPVKMHSRAWPKKRKQRTKIDINKSGGGAARLAKLMSTAPSIAPLVGASKKNKKKKKKGGGMSRRAHMKTFGM